VKTTIDLADALFQELKRVAEERGTTLRALLEEGARLVLERQPPKRPFKLRDASFKGGKGLYPGIREGDWEQQRAQIYGDDELDEEALGDQAVGEETVSEDPPGDDRPRARGNKK
jgi:hypothetical protein